MDSHVDVLVVGAGSSGAAVAGFLAARGLRVHVVERRPLAHAGARWINGVPRAAFHAAGIPLPGPDESGGVPLTFHLVADGHRAIVADHDAIDIDMRKLVARLQAIAADAGATFIDRVTVHGRDGDVVRTSAGPMRARWIIDASGLAGARLIDQPAIPRDRVCAAWQEVREVRDRDAALAHFAAHGVPPDAIFAQVAVAGGFSTMQVRLHDDGATCGILTGSLPALGFPSGRALLERFVAEHAWVGPRIFGGGGPIPLGRAHARLAQGNVALLGDAGAQVFPAHGSGVGAGLVAARLLADTIAAERPLRDYEVAWHRGHGATHAFFESMRRWNQQVDAREVGRLMHLGLLDAETLRAGVDQTMPRPSLARLPQQLRALIAQPALLGVVARAAAARGLSARYPRSEGGVATWARAVDWLLGA